MQYNINKKGSIDMNRMKQLRLERNLNMRETANLLNIPYTTYVNYEKGTREPNPEMLITLANFFKVSIDYLLNRNDERTINTNRDNDLYKTYSNISPIKTKKFRMLGSIACGEPIYANEEYETYIEASAEINADFCLTAKGDSMINARIFDGDIVFIREQPDVENGEIAAIIIDDEATLKRVYKYKNRIELRAENPLYQPLNYEGYKLNEIKILGKAVAFQSYVK